MSGRSTVGLLAQTDRPVDKQADKQAGIQIDRLAVTDTQTS